MHDRICHPEPQLELILGTVKGWGLVLGNVFGWWMVAIVGETPESEETE
jgi:hypothetical protein